MFEKPCRCGKQKKNFRIDIGPFFIEDCCILAGFDALGNKVEPLLSIEDLQKAESLEVVDHPELDSIAETAPTDFKAETSSPEIKAEAAPKKKRSYNRGGNIKKES